MYLYYIFSIYNYHMCLYFIFKILKYFNLIIFLIYQYFLKINVHVFIKTNYEYKINK